MTEWQGTNHELLKAMYNRTLTLRHSDRTDFTILTLRLATKIQTSLTRFSSIRLVKREDFCGATALILLKTA